MRFTTFAAGAILAAFPLVQAGSTGSVSIYNKCDFDVYLWSIDADSDSSEPTTLESNTGTYSEQYKTPSFGGVSLKLSNDTSNSGAITQVEYTLDGFIWYDVSNVNCQGNSCPFEKYGMYLESGSGCPTVSCAGGVSLCKGAYNDPDDNEDSLSCESSADTAVYLCTDSASGSSGSSSSASASGGMIGSSPSAAAGASSTTAPSSSAWASSSAAQTPDYNQPSASASSGTPSSSAAVVAAAQPSTLTTTAAPAVATVYTTVTAAATVTTIVQGNARRHHAHHPRDFQRH